MHGGTGGQGLAKFNGIGGRGGDVYVVGKEKISLKNVIKLCPNKRITASKGEDSRYFIHQILSMWIYIAHSLYCAECVKYSIFNFVFIPFV